MRQGLICLAVFGALIFSSTSRVRADASTRPTSVAVPALSVLADVGHEWIGKAMAEGLTAELRKNPSLVVTDNPTEADWVLSGTIQVLDDQMKVDARMTRASDGAAKNLTATGAVHDLFTIETNLGEHASRMLTPPRQAVASAAPVAIPLTDAPSLYQSTYFSGDVTQTLAVPDRFGDERDKYNLQPTNWDLINTYGCGMGGFGGSCGGSGGACFGGGGGFAGGGASSAFSPGGRSNGAPVVQIGGW